MVSVCVFYVVIKVKGRAVGAVPGFDLFYYSLGGGQCRDGAVHCLHVSCVPFILPYSAHFNVRSV